MRGQGEPAGWEDRFSIDRNLWSENWHLYERDMLVQEDPEWFAEAIYHFYRKHLDKLIKENDKLWGDFCKKKYDDYGNELGLELSTWGYDCTKVKLLRLFVLIPISPTRNSNSLWKAQKK